MCLMCISSGKSMGMRCCSAWHSGHVTINHQPLCSASDMCLYGVHGEARMCHSVCKGAGGHYSIMLQFFAPVFLPLTPNLFLLFCKKQSVLYVHFCLCILSPTSLTCAFPSCPLWSSSSLQMHLLVSGSLYACLLFNEGAMLPARSIICYIISADC